jgi:hypothetical protein
LLISFSVLPLKIVRIRNKLPFGNEFQGDNLAAAFATAFVDFTEGSLANGM